MQTNINDLLKMKQNKNPISCLTCYDASFAYWFNKAEIDVLLIGDTLGEIIQGHKNTLPVTVENIAYHTANVSRNLTHCFLMADIPFLQHATLDKVLFAAEKIMQAGACMIKLEGGSWLAPTVNKLTELGIPVCAHLGFTPQSIHSFGRAKIVGRAQTQAQTIINDAKNLTAAGAQLLIVECIPDNLTKTLATTLSCPVIGIGSGPDADGQILVSYDALGITPTIPPIAKCFLTEKNNTILAASLNYKNQVSTKQFPLPRENT
jgi:3-methyl-2-oxobutanoate hydroxymethyltransferase